MRKIEKPETPHARNEEKNASVGEDLNFAAVDVETANSNVSSICEVGIAVVRSAKITEVWTQLIDPDDFFDPYNTAIHSINHNMVRGCPRFEEICDKVAEYLGEIVISHTLFDRRAISKAFAECGKSLEYETWIDSAQVARRVWPEKYAQRGYSLGNVAHDLGISFRHHDAGEDARVAAEIVLRACAYKELGMDELLRRETRPKPAKLQAKVQVSPRRLEPTAGLRHGEEPRFAEIVVFTGTLSIPRREAAAMAVSRGYEVKENVTRKTTILVVGDQNPGRQGNRKKTSKHRKAEDLIRKGQPIRILGESDFRRLI